MKAIYSTVIVVIITLVFIFAVYQSFTAAPSVQVTSLKLNVEGPEDGLTVSEKPLVSSPFRIRSLSFFGADLNFTNNGNKTVSVITITTNMSGFSISSTYFSESLPLSLSPGQTKTLYVAVETPSFSYSGPVNLTVILSGRSKVAG